jgi:hypothetical protein
MPADAPKPDGRRQSKSISLSNSLQRPDYSCPELWELGPALTAAALFYNEAAGRPTAGALKVESASAVPRIQTLART